MNTLDVAISCGVTPRKASTTNGGEYHSPCPMCGGNDRFHVWPHDPKKDCGSWWCRGCGKGGDAIQLLRDAKGMGYREACAYLGVEAQEGRAEAPGGTPHAPRKRGDAWTPRATPTPEARWQKNATAFVEACHTALLKNPEQMAYLAGRGVTEASVRAHALGWNDKDAWRQKKAWGLEEDGKKLYLPAGITIPWHVGGQLHRVRVRRSAPDAEQRYLVVKGSGSAAMMIKPDQCPAGGGAPVLVVEAELDAVLIAQEAGDMVAALALGNSSAKPDETVAVALEAAPQILVALDFDAAGGKAWAWWQKRYPQADRWPVPVGKDPGDYYKAGSDIRAWVVQGLAPGLRPRPETPPTPEPEPPTPTPPAAKEEETEDLSRYQTTPYRCPGCGKPMEFLNLSSTPGIMREPCAACVLKGWAPKARRPRPHLKRRPFK